MHKARSQSQKESRRMLLDEAKRQLKSQRQEVEHLKSKLDSLTKHAKSRRSTCAAVPPLDLRHSKFDDGHFYVPKISSQEKSKKSRSRRKRVRPVSAVVERSSALGSELKQVRPVSAVVGKGSTVRLPEGALWGVGARRAVSDVTRPAEATVHLYQRLKTLELQSN